MTKRNFDLLSVQGVVLSAMPIGEYDKRIVLLTRERGKIAAFAKGARRLNSPFMAACSPFVFGTFTLYEGRNSYNLNQVSVTRSFVELAALHPGIYYGYYFLELADYFGKEGTDEKELMNLLYVSILALCSPALENRLVRCVFELRAMTEEGMMPAVFACGECGKKPEDGGSWYFSMEHHGILCRECAASFLRETGSRRTGNGAPFLSGIHPAAPGTSSMPVVSLTAIRTLQYIATAPMGRLYTFTVNDQVLGELEKVSHTYVARNTDRRFKSLKILEVMMA